MKKILLLAIVLLAAGTVNAQSYFNGDRADYNSFYQPKMGFEFGAVMSNTTGSSNFNTSSLAGFSAGFAFDLPVSYPFSIAPAILYSQKGYSANTQFGNFTQRSQYVDAPILAKFHAGHSINLYLGPQVSYMIASSNNFGSNFSSATRQSFAYSGSRIFYDGVIGAGVDISNSIELHARYTIDLQGTNSNGNNYISTYRNQAWQVGLGFKFN